jgi:hypothetical protein
VTLEERKRFEALEDELRSLRTRVSELERLIDWLQSQVLNKEQHGTSR